ncbi:telomere attrition and p53 response 1 protein isoform X2 [Tachysurus fulvidraco]|uniref:telomere attrition and p53 response 1 protein isoform X2 n=1 Tax=Tachysurus fulvidraco TaxID=1234273 RepID=UPI001FEE0902|nr:telomere attrition and p53 response 1 protein isoform X2 [Tachysurus fulvidraco]
MEDRKEDNEAEIQEHGPEHWFSHWESQCLAEAEQQEPSEEEVDHNREKLWHMFQNSATAVAQVYKESVDAHQRSYELGIQTGQQRRNKEVLAWVKKRRRTIRREDLISFLCGKAPPPRVSRATPRIPPSWPPPSDSVSSVETDLQPFREAIALHGLSGAMAGVSVRPGTPGSPTHVSGGGSNPGRRRNGLHDVDLNTFIAEEMELHLENNGGGRKRTSAQCSDVITDSPTHKRNRTI